MSGGLVTLLFGLAALATQTKSTYTLPHQARSYLYVALVLFGVSAVLAIVTNLPLKYKNITPSGLQMVVSEERWDDDEGLAQMNVASTRVRMLIWNRVINTRKAYVLIGAIVVQIAAVVYVALAVYEVLKHAPVS